MRYLPVVLAFAAFASPAFADGTITTSNDVLAAMTRSIAGEDATVTVSVPEGADPATWEPGIAEISAIQEADLIVLNGAGYEPWAGRVSLPRARTIDTTAAVEGDLIHIGGLTHSHGDGPAHSHDGIAPVVWMDFGLAAKQAQAIATALDRHDPDQTDVHAANLTTLDARLSALGAMAKAAGTALDGQTVLVAQPGYEYFARAYDIALHETTFDPTVPATPEQLQALDAAAADSGARIMLWNAAPPPATAEALAARNITIVVLPNGADTPEGQNPLDLIETGLQSLAAAATPT